MYNNLNKVSTSCLLLEGRTGQRGWVSVSQVRGTKAPATSCCYTTHARNPHPPPPPNWPAADLLGLSKNNTATAKNKSSDSMHSNQLLCIVSPRRGRCYRIVQYHPPTINSDLNEFNLHWSYIRDIRSSKQRSVFPTLSFISLWSPL